MAPKTGTFFDLQTCLGKRYWLSNVTEFAWLPPNIAESFCKNALYRDAARTYCAFDTSHLELDTENFVADVFVENILYCRGPWQGFHFFTKSSPPKLGHPNMRRQLRRHHHHKPGSSQNNCRCGNYASTAHKDSIHEDSGDKPGGLTKYLGLRILNASNPNISKN